MDPVPSVGEHTDAILLELGYPAEEIRALREAGVIGPVQGEARDSDERH
jgi:itaconate CoA-transferase